MPARRILSPSRSNSTSAKLPRRQPHALQRGLGAFPAERRPKCAFDSYPLITLKFATILTVSDVALTTDFCAFQLLLLGIPES